MVNTEIISIIFFSAEDGEALYSQQKQDQELTVAQIMNSLSPRSKAPWYFYQTIVFFYRLSKVKQTKLISPNMSPDVCFIEELYFLRQNPLYENTEHKTEVGKLFYKGQNSKRFRFCEAYHLLS